MAKKKAKKSNVNSRKTFFKVAKRVHALNKKKGLGLSWNESQKLVSAEIFPEFRGKPRNRVSIKSIDKKFKDSQEQPSGALPFTPSPTPKPKEICFNALNVPAEDLMDKEWWFVGDEDIWLNFDDNLPIRIAFDGVIDTGIIKRKSLPDMVQVREDLRKQLEPLKLYPPIIFKILVQPNKQDDGQPCSYYVLVTLEGSSYDMGGDEIFSTTTEEDLSEEEQESRRLREKELEKKKKEIAKKKKAKARVRPKKVEGEEPTPEPEPIPEPKPKPEPKSQLELEKVKAKKMKEFNSALKTLEKQFKAGVFTKKEYKDLVKKLTDKLEKGGQV